jgi:hypothetical protein
MKNLRITALLAAATLAVPAVPMTAQVKAEPTTVSDLTFGQPCNPDTTAGGVTTNNHAFARAQGDTGIRYPSGVTISVPVTEGTGMKDEFVNCDEGHLTSILMRFVHGSFDTQFALLKQKYGTPTKYHVVKFKNSDGQKWLFHDASWNLKNGDSIAVYDDEFGEELTVKADWNHQYAFSTTKSPK